MPQHVSNREDKERLLTGYSGHICLSLALGWLAFQLGRTAIPPLLPVIIEDLAISPAQAGFVLTLMQAIYALVQYPSGKFSDQLSRKTVLVAGLVLTITGFFLLTSASSYFMLLLSVVFVGLGGGFYFSPARALLSDTFVERRGQAFGIQTSAGMIGNTLAGGLAVTTLAISAWQITFWPPMVLLAVTAGLFHRWSRESYTISSVSLDVYETVSPMLKRPQIRWIIVAYGLGGFVIKGTIGFFPTFLQVEKGLSPTIANTLFALLFMVGIGVGPIAGRIGDRVPRLMVLVGSLLTGVFGIIGTLVTHNPFLITLSVVTIAAGIWTFIPIRQAYVMDQFKDDSLGGNFGALKTMVAGFASLGPVYVGVVAGKVNYTMAFGGLVLVLLISAFILGLSKNSW